MVNLGRSPGRGTKSELTKGDESMKYEVRIWTDKGCFSLPFKGYYKTKKEADQVAENARQIEETVKAEVIRKK